MMITANPASHKTYRAGFVYVLTNDSMPGKVKVGETSWLAEDRARGLFTTGVPEEFKVAFRAITMWPKAVEARAFELLDAYRVNGRREFFRVTVSQASEALRLAMLDVAGIAKWVSSKPHIVRVDDRLALCLEAGQIFVLLTYNNVFEPPTIKDIWQAHSDGDLLEISGSESAAQVAGMSHDDPGHLCDPVPFLDRDCSVTNGNVIGRERLTPGERLLWLPGPQDAAQNVNVLFEASDYCQVVNRTWRVQSDAVGTPLILNMLTHDNIWPAAVSHIQGALSLTLPRNMHVGEALEATHETFGSKAPPPNYWLPQLAQRTRKSKPRKRQRPG